MPDFLVYASKNNRNKLQESIISLINRRICPDNIEVLAPTTMGNERLSIVLFDPIKDIEIENTSLYLGHIFKDLKDPSNIDGAYARINCDRDNIQIDTDALGSKSVWYYFDEDRFIASTSQRAIVIILGAFDLNMDAVYVFLNTGILGFGLSWDKNIRSCKSNETVKFNVTRWSLRIDKACKMPEFSNPNTSESKQIRKLELCLKETFDCFNIPSQRTVLPLSGGYDSRFILLQLIKNGIIPKTITWGHPDSLKDANNDAYVAQELAKHFGTDHSFLPSYHSFEPLEVIFDRFIRLGEGRIENVYAYMDGFHMWKHLRESGISGVIRGDEIFGWSPVATSKDVLNSNGLLFKEDYTNGAIIAKLGCKEPNSSWETSITKNHRESYATWRDRLYQEYMVPNFYASLNYLKSKYVNVYTPYYSRNIVKVMRNTSDKLRTEKQIFRKIVNSKFSSVKIAKNPANIQSEELFSSRPYLELISDKITSHKGNGMFSPKGIDSLLASINRDKKPISSTEKGRVRLKDLIPEWARSMMKQTGLYKQKFYIDYGRLSFRIYILYEVTNMLEADSNFNRFH